MIGPIVIAAGGTGGHLFPAEALAAELQARGRTVALMTDARTATQAASMFPGAASFVLKGAGIAGRGVVRAAQAAIQLGAGTMQAARILSDLKPSVIVGFGGYPTVPPVLAAQAMFRRPRVILHEQNAVLGRANRSLSRLASALALSVPETKRVPASARAVVTGMPLRPAIIARAGTPYVPASSQFRLLVLGGSLGARVFSNVLPDAIARLPEAMQANLLVTQQCRAEDIDRVRSAYQETGVTPTLAVFFADVAGLLTDAHLAIARAGASTVAELAALGRPSILVPLPGAIDDHQRANARALADAGGAWMMDQSTFTAPDLADFLESLLIDPSFLTPIAEAAARFGRIDATKKLADLVEQTITGSKS